MLPKLKKHASLTFLGDVFGVGFFSSLLSVMLRKNEYLSGFSSIASFFTGEGVRGEGLWTLGLPGKEPSSGEASRLASLPPRDIVGLKQICH